MRTYHSHKQKGQDIKITVREIEDLAKNTNHCPICGVELNYKIGEGKNYQNSPSLDRINNENHLDKENVMIICFRCNTTKGKRTIKQMKEWCEKYMIFYTHKENIEKLL